MKIAYVVDKAAPFFVGGYEVRAQALSKFLARRHEVRLYTSLDRAQARIDEVDYVRVCPTTFQVDRSGQRSIAHSSIFASSLLSDPFKGWNPDAIVIEAIPYLQLATMSSWVRGRGCAYILTVNEAWHNYPFGPKWLVRPSRWLLGALLRRGIKFSTAVVAISTVTAEGLRRNFGAQEVECVPMGLDVESLGVSTVREPEERKYDFVTMGRLVQIKRVDVFLEALSALKRHHKWRGTAAIIGDGPLLHDLQLLAHSLDLGSQIEFLGFLTEEAKHNALSEGRIFVLPSEREGFSMATLEAMAHGLPAVVARPRFDEVFGTSDFVRDGVTGRYFPDGDITALASTLNSLLIDPNTLRVLSAAARRLALAYTWEAAGSTLERTIVRHVEE